MFGLAIMFLFALYLVLAAGLVWLAVRWAKQHGRRPWVWGVLTALVMYNLVFWDWIPTVVAHNYYCKKEAGFWVYKTLEQWKQENPGVMEELVYNKTMPHVQTSYGAATILNQRFLHTYKYEGPLPLNRWRIETEIRDSGNGEVIAREINFSTSQVRRQAGWTGWKFWLDSEQCNIESHRDQGSFDKITSQFEGAKK